MDEVCFEGRTASCLIAPAAMLDGLMLALVPPRSRPTSRTKTVADG
jgi:hypothetical protein